MAPLVSSRRARSAPQLGAVARPLCVAAIAIAVCVAYFGLPPLNQDVINALVSGRDLFRGVDPRLDLGPTPHPLMNALGGLASLLGTDAAYTTLSVFALVTLGALLAGVYRLGEVARSPVVGVVAALLVGTSTLFLSRALVGFQDIPALALVVWAAALEVERPKRVVAVLALLTLAGLIRPELWLLSAAYVAYLALADGLGARTFRAAAIAAIAPAVWLLSDLVITGDALFSLTHTQDLAGALGRETGLASVPETLVDNLRGLTRLPVLAAGAAGLCLAGAFRDRRLAAPAAIVGVGLAAYAVIGIFDLSLIDRYLIPAATMLTVFAAYACVGGPARPTPVLVALLGAALSLAVAVSVVRRIDDYPDLRSTLDRQEQIRSDLRDVAGELGACRPVHLYQARGPAPFVAHFADLRRAELERFGTGGQRGSFLRPRSAVVANAFSVAGLEPRIPPAPRGARRAAVNGSWEVWVRGC